MFAERSPTAAVSGIPKGNSPLESERVNVGATIGNHHTRLFVPRIPPP
ncbi:hypothetical protein AVEN_220571-1, partial [Araneus ventricosus]